MDIISALDAAPTRGTKKCVIQRFLDDIPDDTPGKPELIASAECANQRDPDYRTRTQMLGVFSKLGLTTSESTIGDHRNRACRCYW